MKFFFFGLIILILDKVLDLRPTGCVYNLLFIVKKKKIILIFDLWCFFFA
jgi:hypothetical protein